MASVIRNCKQLTCRLGGTRITPVMRITGPGGSAAAAGQGLRAAAVKQRSGPQRSGPQQRHGAAAARAGLVAVGGGISGPQLLHAAQQHGPGKAGRRPRAPRRPRPPPTQRKQQQSRACRPGFPAAVAQKKAPAGNQQPGRGFCRQPRGGGRWHSISDAGPRTTSWGVIQQWQLMKGACL